MAIEVIHISFIFRLMLLMSISYEIVRKRLHGELYSPSFSARNIFCKSRFRNDETTYDQEINGVYDDTQKYEENDFNKDDKRRNILMKVIPKTLFRNLNVIMNNVDYYISS